MKLSVSVPDELWEKARRPGRRRLAVGDHPVGPVTACFP